MMNKYVLLTMAFISASLQTTWGQQQKAMKVWHDGIFKGFVINDVDSVTFVNLATGVSISQTEMTMEIGENKKLTATVFPDNVDPKVTWKSSDASVASVDEDGEVTGNSAGFCTVVCQVVDGINVHAECQVKVGNTDGIPVTCEEAAQLTTELPGSGATSLEIYVVTGYITEVVGSVSRNQQTFWMADTKDGGKVLEAYWANLPEGVSEFKAGMKVTIIGKLYKYVSSLSGDVTPEIKNANVVILEDVAQEVIDLVNGGFEEWVSDTEPLGWKSASLASNADLSKSAEARSGNYACLVHANATNNKRLATQEITLEAGSYTFSFNAKSASASASASQVKCGYVPVTLTDSNYNVGSYTYSNFIDINNEWTLVSYDFTLSSETTVCLIVMNPKSNNNAQYTAQDILVDDITLVRNN